MPTKYVTGGLPRFKHQKEGLRRAIETRGNLALIMDPGTGKTATALDYIGLLALKSPRREARVLVVAPYAAVDTWVKQAPYWLSPQVSVWAEVLGGTGLQKIEGLAARGGQPYPKPLDPKGKPETYARALLPIPRALHRPKSWVIQTRTLSGEIDPALGPDGLGDELPRVVLEVVNFEMLSHQRRKITPGKTLGDALTDAVERFDPDLMVVDESHKAKSPSGAGSQMLARLARRIPRRMLLSGTIMPHSPMDVFSQWRILDPYAFGKIDQRTGTRRAATFGGFKTEYAQLGGFMGREIVGFRNLDRMQDIMARNSFVVRKEDALDLPTTTDVVHPVRLSSKEEKAYRQMKADLAAALPDGGDILAMSRLTQRIRLRQITSGYVSDGDVVQELGDSKLKTMCSVIQDELAGENRIVVFCYFSHEIAALSDALAVAGTEVLTVTGSTPQATRMAYRERFGSDDPARLVMVAQTRTMSVSVNELVTASHALFGSLSEQRDDLIQARDRLNRIGQTRPVTFHYFLAPRTVDEVIYQTMQDRTDLESAMLKHVKDATY